jgi:hypothetical protein
MERPFNDDTPKDREILIWAQWDWDGMNGDDTDCAYAWRVAEWRGEDEGRVLDAGFWSASNNPYSDRAVRPLWWAELPAPPPERKSHPP